MANYFNQNQLSQRQVYEQKYNKSRMNLLLIVLFTAINLFLLVTNSDSYFLFSAAIPYYMTGLGMLFCGMFPEEYYVDGIENYIFWDNSYFYVLLAISIVITLLYLLAWLMSNKNRVGWMIFSLVFFGIDTLAMLWLSGVSVDMIIDIIFHVWVIVSLALGIHAHCKLKTLPAEEKVAIPAANEADPTTNTVNTQSSNIIRIADNDVKHRVLAQAQVANYDICYRRVKRTNELVVNGNVYDEIEALVERPHALKATVDGNLITASFNGTHSIICFNGEEKAKKLRLF